MKFNLKAKIMLTGGESDLDCFIHSYIFHAIHCPQL